MSEMKTQELEKEIVETNNMPVKGEVSVSAPLTRKEKAKKILKKFSKVGKYVLVGGTGLVVGLLIGKKGNDCDSDCIEEDYETENSNEEE